MAKRGDFRRQRRIAQGKRTDATWAICRNRVAEEAIHARTVLGDPSKKV